MIYYDNLSFISFFSTFFKYKISSRKFKTIYFIDSSFLSKIFLIPILEFCGLTIHKLDFTMMEIVDKNQELVRLRIHRVDLFNFYSSVEKSPAYKALFHQSWNQNNIIDFIKKGLTGGSNSTIFSNSSSRMLFKINVVNWHAEKLAAKELIFVVSSLPWFEIYQEYANQFKIAIYESNVVFFKGFNIKIYIRSKPILYKLIKNLKYRYSNNNFNFSKNIKLYLNGRGDLSLVNDGEHSDFFWQQNSTFSTTNLLFKHLSNEEKSYLSDHNIDSVAEGVYYKINYIRNYKKPKLNYSCKYKIEYKLIKSLLDSYNLEKLNYSSLFRKFNVKILFNWDKYSNDHIAWSDAIRDNGGISTNWQMAFDGFKNVECLINSDIVFSFSKFSDEIEKKLESKIKYNVIVGYPKDYAASLLKDEAYKLREKLKANGAKKIIFTIDENSVDDSRWHTGHELQRENYSYIIEKVLEVPWLGVVFKPKRAITLRKRLGPVADILEKAEATGRCYVYESSGRYTTSAPPILAGLSADVCIHSHLCGGTAGLECALEGLPTLLINREGIIDSKLNQLPQDKVVFKDWPSTIDAIMEHFNTPGGISGFGDWTSIIDDLDPFRDGMAAFRMGTYLQWLVEGFENNLDREVIMANAAERYKKQWGDDKVITA